MTAFFRTAALVALVAAAPAAAETLLTATAHGETRTYDRAALEALPAETFETSTIWTDGTQTFTGVPLSALMEELGIEAGTLTATAINDYAVEIPVADVLEDGPILAYEMDGAPMSRRDKGPLWIVYPYDADPAFRTETVYARSIWQLDEISHTP